MEPLKDAAGGAPRSRWAPSATALVVGLWAVLVAGYGGTWFPARATAGFLVLVAAVPAVAGSRDARAVPRLAAAGLAAWLLLGLLQAMPLPGAAAARLLPWRAPWWEAWAVPGVARCALSGAPGRTLWAVVWLVVWAGWVGAGQRTDPRRLLRGLVGVGGVLGLVVIVQRLGGAALCRLAWPATRGAALPLGPFLNKNHAAGLLAALLALAVWVAWDVGLQRPGGISRAPRWRGLGPQLGAAIAALSCVAAALVLSLSRGGLLAGIGGVAVTAALLAGRSRGRRDGRRAWVLAAMLVPAAAAVLALSLPAVERRLSTLGDPEALLRREVKPRLWSDTWHGFRAAPLLGWGLGAFEVVYPAFRTARYPGDFLHAEQELLEHLFEAGAVGLLASAALVAGIVRAGGRRALAAPCGPAVAGALTALALHGMVECIWHVGATQALAGLLAGAWLGTGGQPGPLVGEGSAPRRADRIGWRVAAGVAAAVALVLGLSLTASALRHGRGALAVAARLDPWRAGRWWELVRDEPARDGSLSLAGQRLLALEPAAWRWRLWMARRAAERGALEEMEAWLRQVDRLSPHHWLARDQSGWLRLAWDLDRAERDLGEAVRGWPAKDRAGLARRVGEYLARVGDAGRLPGWLPVEALPEELGLDVAESLLPADAGAAVALLARALPAWGVPAPWDRARLARLGLELPALPVPYELLERWRSRTPRLENWELPAASWIRQRLGDEAGSQWLAAVLGQDERCHRWRALWAGGGQGGGTLGDEAEALRRLGAPGSADAAAVERARAAAERGGSAWAYWMGERALGQGRWAEAFVWYQQAAQGLVRAAARRRAPAGAAEPPPG